METKTNKKTKSSRLIPLVAFAATALLASSALAWGGPFGRGGGPGGHHRGMKGLRCAKMLMHAPGEVLKEKLKLSDAQVAKLEPIRMNFLTKKIKGQADLQLGRLQLRKQMQADLPDQNKVLQLMRKQRNLRGRIHEEGLKAYIQALKLMSAEQRKALREKCRKMGKGRFGRHFGRGGPGRFGGGPGRFGGGPGRFGGGPGGHGPGPRWAK